MQAIKNAEKKVFDLDKAVAEQKARLAIEEDTKDKSPKALTKKNNCDLGRV